MLEKAHKVALENKKVTRNSFKQGYIQRADVLSVEVRVSEVSNQLLSAKSNINNASDYLSFLMNEKENHTYIPSDSLIVAGTISMSPNSISEGRADIMAMQSSTKAYESMHKSDRMAFIPRLNAFGSYELNDAQAFKGATSGYLIGAQLNWNLFRRLQKHW